MSKDESGASYSAKKQGNTTKQERRKGKGMEKEHWKKKKNTGVPNGQSLNSLTNKIAIALNFDPKNKINILSS